MGRMRIPPGHPDYSRWIVNHAAPKRQRQMTPRVPALADVELYDGTRALVEVEVAATADGMVCVRQDLGDRDWFAWVNAERVRRR